MKENHESMDNQYLKKHVVRDFTGFQEKKRHSLPEDKELVRILNR